MDPIQFSIRFSVNNHFLMKQMGTYLLQSLLFAFLGLFSCKKTPTTPVVPPVSNFILTAAKVDAKDLQSGIPFGVLNIPTIKLTFNQAIDRTSSNGALLIDLGGIEIPLGVTYENNDSTLVLTPTTSLKGLSKFTIKASTLLKSKSQTKLNTETLFTFTTQVDPIDKLPVVSDDAMLDTVQRRTFQYFWNFGHPVSGLARERNTSGDIVTSGGSGFGIMTIPVAVERNFITRAQGLSRMQKIVSFLKNTAQTFHGAYPHWLNGSTGKVVPFSPKDDGADLVETSYLMAGLLTAREYFNTADAAESSLRNDINAIWNAVEWNWFRQGSQQVLYWHWSPNNLWAMNMKIEGWNECLITYIMAASSNTDSIPSTVYHNGFAKNGAFKNGSSYYGYTLPLGPTNGGPLFWAQYSFLGIDPNGLTDKYANYQTQVINHSKINYEYCKSNPRNFYGYSDKCWGLTASDIPNGYSANEPNNDIGVITPTAALSSMPFTPTESMGALKYFYYTLGDRLWGEYGFYDAFSMKDLWFAPSTLAIDQGPIVIMIENHRSKLIWNLLSNAPEIKRGMKQLGFAAPYL